MKVIKCLLILICGISIATLFNSCTKDDDPITPTGPTITVTSPGEGSSYIAQENVTLTFKAEANDGIKRVVVKYLRANGSESTVFDTTITSSTTTLNYSKTFTVGGVGNESFTITLTDNKNTVQSKTVNIKSTTGFATEQFGSLYHIAGTLPGAWDLVNGVAKAIGDAEADKDMKNYDDIGLFTGSFTATNGTKFVSAPGFNYSTGTTKDAKATYEAGSPSVSVPIPVPGAIYIAKLRNSESWVIIKILSNEPLNNDCNCSNKGKVSFTYKKSI